MFELHDVDHLHSVKGSNGKRAKSGVAKTVGCRNRLVDRNLILYQDRCNVEIEDMEKFSAKIQESTLKGLGTFFFNKFIQSTTSTSKHDPLKCPQKFTGIHGG